MLHCLERGSAAVPKLRISVIKQTCKHTIFVRHFFTLLLSRPQVFDKIIVIVLDHSDLG